jgi:OOP family OmpA-OmpF porin
MTNNWRIPVLLGLSAAAVAVSPLASAQSASPYYLGGGLGQTTNKYNTTDFSAGAGVSESKDQKDTAWKMFGGYRFNQNWAAELGYTNLGKFTYGNSAATGSFTETYKTSSWTGAAVGTMPLMNGFSLLGKAGLAYNVAKGSISGSGAFGAGATAFNPTGTKRKTDLLLGVGLNYDFSPQVGMRLEYEDFGKFGTAIPTTGASANGNIGRAKDSLWSMNLVYRF